MTSFPHAQQLMFFFFIKTKVNDTAEQTLDVGSNRLMFTYTGVGRIRASQCLRNRNVTIKQSTV